MMKRKIKLFLKQLFCIHSWRWVGYNAFYHYRVYECEKCKKREILLNRDTLN